MAHKRKLIEVALPLEVINRESAREKSIRHGHPSTLHLWWARRPLAAARAVLFAQLVDDPSSHPDRFPTEEAQKAERERLHKIIEELVVWEKSLDERVLDRAKAEIRASFPDGPPAVMDPFTGGGTIPLEAKRLGLDAWANDLNPLPVLINTVMLDLVDRFKLAAPVSGGVPGRVPEMLATDLRHYAQLLESRAAERAGGLYPRHGGGDPLVYFWARTVTCPNPACQAEVPLVGSWTASARRGSEAFFRPVYDQVTRTFDVEVVPGRAAEPEGTKHRTGAVCPACEGSMTLDHIKFEGRAGRLGARMLAMQVRHGRDRSFVPATDEQRWAAVDVGAPDVSFLDAELSTHSQYMAPPLYGLTRFRDLFSPRQLAMLATFVELLDEIQAIAVSDAEAAGLHQDTTPYVHGGSGTTAYGEAIRMLLALGIGRLVNRQSTLCIWNAPGVKVEQVFARQAYSMTWLFAEANPFAGASGSFSGQIDYLVKSLAALPTGHGHITQGPAQTVQPPADVVISTDPPYYDNVPYADLSDFFLVWHRRMLSQTLDIFPTMLAPKSEELVADHTRWGGRRQAREFFEGGFEDVFSNLITTHANDVPMTVYYAFRQSDATAEGTASTGWETVLEALIRAGWTVDGTWPMRTEQAGGLRSFGRNALASSVVIVCRKRSTASPATDRPGFIAALKAELGEALDKLQAGGIAPVDLPQAAIGPGMAVFSRYSAVREFDGTQMSVRSALARINEVLDEVLSEQEGDFDATSRFCLAWYRQHGYGEGRFGDADNLARARNSAVATMARDEVLHSAAGKVKLFRPSELRADYDVLTDDHTSAWEALHHLIRVLESDGVTAAGQFLVEATSRDDGAVDPELVTELAHLLFRVSEDNKWTKEAISFNSLVTAWTDILDASRDAADSAPTSIQSSLDLGD